MERVFSKSHFKLWVWKLNFKLFLLLFVKIDYVLSKENLAYFFLNNLSEEGFL
jgi:hypothetical protein